MSARIQIYRRIRELKLSASLTETGHHRVNYIGGKEGTAQYVATLDEALAVAEAMAEGRPLPRRVKPETAPPQADPATSAAAAVLRAAHALLQGMDETAPAAIKLEAARLAEAARKVAAVLALAIGLTVAWELPKDNDVANAAAWVGGVVSDAAEAVTDAVEAVADAATEAVQEVIQPGETALPEPAKPRPSVPPAETYLTLPPGYVEEAQAAPHAEEHGVAPEGQTVAEGQPDSAPEEKERATPSPPDEAPETRAETSQ